MQMNLRQIEVFRAVMLSNSIVGAAKMLHVSQPAISRLLAHTERRLGLQLFERIKGRLHPTPDAQKLFTQVQVVYEGVQLVNEMAEDLVENREGTLRLAGTPSLCHEMVPKAIASFCRSYPDVRVVLQTLSPPKLLDAVLTQQAELGLAFFSEPHSAVNSSVIYPNQIVLALPQAHPLAAEKRVDLSAIADLPLIGFRSDIPIGQLIRRSFMAEGLSPRAKIEVEQLHVACALVQEGAGAALVDEITAAGTLWSNVAFRQIKPTVTAPVSAIHANFAPLSRMAKSFLAQLKQVTSEMNSEVKRTMRPARN